MMKDLMKLMEKKKGSKPLDETYKEAKTNMLHALKGEMSDEMGKDVKGLSKVTVAAKNPDDLQAGLDFAKDKVKELEASPESDDDNEEEMESVGGSVLKGHMSSGMPQEGDDEHSSEDLDAMIAHLQAKKKALDSKKSE